jgi:hypothetical protein
MQDEEYHHGTKQRSRAPKNYHNDNKVKMMYGNLIYAFPDSLAVYVTFANERTKQAPFSSISTRSFKVKNTCLKLFNIVIVIHFRKTN